MINVAILMAGRGSRVETLGVPKPFLKFGDQYLYELAMLSAGTGIKDIAFHLILSKANNAFAIERQIDLGKPKALILEDFTKGPAETARLLKIGNREPFFSLDCDLKFEIEEFEWPQDADCHLFWFPSQSESHSFIKTDEKLVIDIVEKEIFSEKGIVGFYGFKSKQFYDYLYDRTNFGAEYFLSDVVKTAIRNNFRVTHSLCRSHTPLGTILEIEAYLDGS